MSVLDQLKGNKPEYTSFTGTLTLSDTISPAALLVSYTGKAPEAKQPDSNRVRHAQLSARTFGLFSDNQLLTRTLLQCCPGHVNAAALRPVFVFLAEGEDAVGTHQF
jgi:hypothetical protein